MIPNNGQWTESNEIGEYLTIPVTPPAIIEPNVHAVALGPYAIGDSRGRLDARYWLVSQSNGKVNIQFSTR
jgi:hypothetical protein